MSTFNFDTIYLGNFSDLDVDESDNDAEHAATILGTYTSIEETALVVNNTNGNSLIEDNEFNPTDSMTYDLGAGSITSGLDSTIVYNGIVTRGDGSTFTTEFFTVQLENGDVFITSSDLDGETVQAVELTSVERSDYSGSFGQDRTYDFSVVCITSGTLVPTATGPVRVERLRPGDRIATLTDGLQPLLLTGSQTCRPSQKTAAIEFEKGSLGPSTPAQRLRVSPQHRMVLSSPIAERMCGSPHVFVAAKHLVGLPGVTQITSDELVTYWHMLFSRHQAVHANGTWVESLLMAPVTLQALPLSSRMRIEFLRKTLDLRDFGRTAFPVFKGKQLQKFLWRCASNSKPFVDPAHLARAQDQRFNLKMA